ncbi:hypothetical protein GKZ68_20990 (plasmid) [Hymenobacter sp. BRD128]|uniref:hypothetical protein n=1 Tax=Hymenobacter sp. BRD128 TaxID=2675878 RepID=UPI001566575F|nr:hypothetical protein [Hymenobacter sp. BRD128]QKG59159.1 hypothetical protein GKZ68_20990 [Hymenobacter sp. BRD128]
MDSPLPRVPSVAFQLPLTHEVRRVTSFTELLRLAGTRVAVGKAWGVALRTYDRRKQDPGSLTVAEVQKLAVVLAVNELDLFAVVSANARDRAAAAAP